MRLSWKVVFIGRGARQATRARKAAARAAPRRVRLLAPTAAACAPKLLLALAAAGGTLPPQRAVPQRPPRPALA